MTRGSGGLAVAALLAMGCAHAPPPPSPPAPATPVARDGFRDAAPPPLPVAPRFEAPVPVERTLPNGLRILVRENHAIPVVVAELMVKTGVDGDPPGKAGLSGVLAAMLEEGTRSRSSQQIAEQLEDLAALLSIYPGLDSTRVHLNVLTETLSAALDLFADVVLRPAFRVQDLERIRGLALTALQQKQGVPSSLANDEVSRLLYGDRHPWGQPAGGTPTSVRAIRRADLVRFHDAWFRPNNAVIAISGDVTPDAAVALVSERFRGWHARPLPPSRLPPFPPGAGREVVLIARPAASQSTIVVGARTIPASHPDAIALSATNFVLGGLFASRLNLELREVKGYSYGFGSAVGYNKATGVIRAAGSVKAQNTVASVASVEKELVRFASGDLTEAEVAQAKSAYIRSLPALLETNDAVAGSLASLLLVGRPLDYFATLPGKVEALGRSDLVHAAQTYFTPARWPLVVAGPTAPAETGLQALELGPVVDRTPEVRAGAGPVASPAPR